VTILSRLSLEDHGELAALQREYAGRWDIWLVRIYKPPGVLWCAKPAGASLGLLRAHAPAHLIAYIAEAEAQQ